MRRSTWIVGAVVLGACIGGAALAADQAGWAVRICRGQTEASTIKITIGDGKAEKLLIDWRSDNQTTNFPVPAPLATARKLTVTADSAPADGKVVMCIMWDHTSAKTMRFTDLLTASAKRGEKDDSCPCR